MNALETYLQSHKLDPIKAMNDLQDVGIISDNCVSAADMANGDCERAINFLNGDVLLI